jgi:hypothetical protein
MLPIVTTRLPEAGPAYAQQLSRPQEYPIYQHISFLRTLSSFMRTRDGLPGWSPITPSEARLTLEFFYGLPEKKLQLIGMSVLINPIEPWVRMSDVQQEVGDSFDYCSGLGCHANTKRRAWLHHQACVPASSVMTW